MQLDTSCLTQTCYNIRVLLSKGKDEGLLQLDCGVNSGCTMQVTFGGCGFQSNALAN